MAADAGFQPGPLVVGASRGRGMLAGRCGGQRRNDNGRVSDGLMSCTCRASGRRLQSHHRFRHTSDSVTRDVWVERQFTPDLGIGAARGCCTCSAPCCWQPWSGWSATSTCGTGLKCRGGSRPRSASTSPLAGQQVRDQRRHRHGSAARLAGRPGDRAGRRGDRAQLYVHRHQFFRRSSRHDSPLCRRESGAAG